LEWQDAGDAKNLNEIVLDAETKRAVIALMASALSAVVRDVAQREEEADER
jgi:hypothetical protein